MKESAVSVPAVAKWLGAIAVAQWLQIPGVVRALLFFMTADYVTGLAAAYVRRELSSAIGWRGLVKKTLVLILLLVAHVGEQSAGLNIHVEQIGAVGYIVSEFISIVENVARAGVPIPAQIVEALLAAKKLSKPATPEQLKALEDGGGEVKA